MSEFVSLDIETSSDDLQGSILSIGLVKYPSGESYYASAQFESGVFVKASAMRINGISVCALDDRFNKPLCKIDIEVFRFLPREAVAMGRGISYFDMAFVAKDLPVSFQRFDRKLFDLTGFMLGLAERRGDDFCALRSKALAYADEKCADHGDCRRLAGHHALYDAWNNCFVLDYLKRL